MGRVYAVVSAKGGVGKTTTAANLAAVLAAAGSDVVVVDGDLGMANLASALGVPLGDVTLHDVLAASGEETEADDVDLEPAIHEGPHGMAVVPGSPDLDAFSRADPEGMEAVLDALRERYEYVVLDTGAGLSNDTVVPLTHVDEALLVSTPSRDALGDTDKTRQVAERLDVPVAGAVLTRADPADADAAVVAERLDAEVVGTIPEAPEIQQASAAGEPLTTFAPGSDAAAAFRSLAAALTGEEVEDAGVADGATEESAESEVAAEDEEPAEPAATASTDEPESTAEDEEPEPTASAAEATPGGEEPDVEAPSPDVDISLDSEADDEDDSGDALAEYVSGDEDIVVAGSHEADLSPEAVDPGEAAAAADATGAVDAEGETEANEDADAESTPSAVEEAESPSLEEPLVETADPDELDAGREAARADDPESGVYTTSLTEEATASDAEAAGAEGAESGETGEGSASTDDSETDADEGGADVEETEADVEEAESSADEEAEADADEEDGGNKRGLFGRFFG